MPRRRRSHPAPSTPTPARAEILLTDNEQLAWIRRDLRTLGLVVSVLLLFLVAVKYWTLASSIPNELARSIAAFLEF